jgi:hypothetical protein
MKVEIVREWMKVENELVSKTRGMFLTAPHQEHLHGNDLKKHRRPLLTSSIGLISSHG